VADRPAATGLRLYGVALLEHGDAGPLPDGAAVVPFRSVGAVVAEAAYALTEPGERDVEAHRDVIERVFAARPVLPAPVGVVFRSHESLVRWLELHYHALVDGLTFVEDRQAARVHVRQRGAPPVGQLMASDLAAAAAESFRALRRHAVAAVPLKSERLTGTALSAAFLVERDQWAQFADAVAAQAARHRELVFERTGPWPPFDFVRMQFGA
jgi:Gas vesicle synthesis protein GvpL/GvpF